MTIVHDDDDIVVVDKPVGVAAHPSVGWTGPTVLGGLAAAGYRISTSGASERQGIVSRLDVGTSRPDGGRARASAPTPCSSGPSRSARSTRPTTRSSRACPTRSSAPSTRPIGRHPGHDYKFAVMESGKPSVTHYELHRGLPARVAARDPPRDRPHPPDPGALRRAAPPLRRRPDLRRRPHAGGAGWAWSGSGCTPSGLGFEHPGSGEWVTFESPYPADLQIALDRL